MLFCNNHIDKNFKKYFVELCPEIWPFCTKFVTIFGKAKISTTKRNLKRAQSCTVYRGKNCHKELKDNGNF